MWVCLQWSHHITCIVLSFEEMRKNLMELLMRKTENKKFIMISWISFNFYINLFEFLAFHWANADRPKRLSFHRHRRFDVLPWFSWLLRCNPRVTMSFVSGECSMRKLSVLQSMTKREFLELKESFVIQKFKISFIHINDLVRLNIFDNIQHIHIMFMYTCVIFKFKYFKCSFTHSSRRENLLKSSFPF